MYYPYFRGKQFELILLRDNAELLKENKICPIIEPVKKDFSSLLRTINKLNDIGTDYILIVNPKAGKEPVPKSSILNLFEEEKFERYNNISIGYLLSANSKITELIDLLNEYKRVPFSITIWNF